MCNFLWGLVFCTSPVKPLKKADTTFKLIKVISVLVYFLNLNPFLADSFYTPFHVVDKIGVSSEIPEWDVPEYAQGTGSHPGGLALVGDG